MATAHRLFGPEQDFALSLRDVGKRFGALVALEGIELDVRVGGRHAILGANGAGKTTLFNCITGDFPPSSGRIRLFGEDVTDRPAHDRIRAGLRRTYQTSRLFRGLTVEENLFLAEQGVAAGRFSMRPAARDHAHRVRARELGEYVGLARLLAAPVADLAHGQQRQLEIGMALAGRPRLVLFDEPAAGLSAAERGDLVGILEDLPRQFTFVIIEHDLEVALRVADRVTVLDQGRFFAEGTPEEIEADPRVQAIYLGEGDG
ncbi:ABC transporter ATP-binding protein [Rhodosalinus sp.]|uniref:ABC transporter ATP-binding protein n=1 Tax=Rhodosalinus sp. TaxID=2047741 RepID=UPI00356A71F2